MIVGTITENIANTAAVIVIAVLIPAIIIIITIIAVVVIVILCRQNMRKGIPPFYYRYHRNIDIFIIQVL